MFSLFDSVNDGEYNGTIFVKISSISVMQGDFLSLSPITFEGV